MISREIESGSKSFRFRWKLLGDSGVTDLVRALIASPNHKVQELDLTGCDIGNVGVTVLAQHLTTETKIETLGLNCNSYGDEGMDELSRMLAANTNLTSLDVSGSRSGDQGLHSLAEGLEENSTLRDLKMTRNSIGAGIGPLGIQSLRRIIDGNLPLARLSLWGSMIGDDGAAQIARGMASNNSIRSLDLGWNNISDVGVGHIAECLEKNRTLVNLDLRNNHMSSRGVSSLNVVLGRWGASVEGPELGNATVEVINIGGNPVFTEGTREVTPGQPPDDVDRVDGEGGNDDVDNGEERNDDEDDVEGVGRLSDFVARLQESETHRTRRINSAAEAVPRVSVVGRRTGSPNRWRNTGGSNEMSKIVLRNATVRNSFISSAHRSSLLMPTVVEPAVTPMGESGQSFFGSDAPPAEALLPSPEDPPPEPVSEELLARAKALRKIAVRQARVRRKEAEREAARANAEAACDQLLNHLLPQERARRLRQAKSLVLELRGDHQRTAAELKSLANAKAARDREWTRNRALHLRREIDDIPAAEAKRLWNKIHDDRRLWKDVESRSLFPAI